MNWLDPDEVRKELEYVGPLQCDPKDAAVEFVKAFAAVSPMDLHEFKVLMTDARASARKIARRLGGWR